MSREDRARFGPHTIFPDHIQDIELRLAPMPRPDVSNPQSAYMVFAYPVNAKIKASERSFPRVVSVWPEICIGIIKEEGHRDGATKIWAAYPVLRNGRGWRKASIGATPGRTGAAQIMLHWICAENAKRLPKESSNRSEIKKATKAAIAHATFDAYMKAYDNFATDNREVSEALDITIEATREIGRALEQAGLIVIEPFEQHGAMRVSGAGIKKSRGDKGRYEPDTWQCYQTYDYLDRLQAIDLFIEKMPTVAALIKKYIADEMKRTRKEKIDVYQRIK